MNLHSVRNNNSRAQPTLSKSATDKTAAGLSGNIILLFSIFVRDEILLHTNTRTARRCFFPASDSVLTRSEVRLLLYPKYELGTRSPRSSRKRISETADS